jgi:Spy/CpxP family protein refolding chaperone
MAFRFARFVAASLVALSCAAAALISGTPAFAQQPPVAQKGPLAELNLSKDQEEKMKTIQMKYKPQFDAIGQKVMSKYKADIETLQKSTDPPAVKQQKGDALKKKIQKEVGPGVRSIMSKMLNEMDTVLKPDQKAKFAKMKQKALADFDKSMKA